MTLLVVLGAWFVAGLLATLVLGPRLRRAAELAGTALEPEPVYAAGRSPLRWRLGTLGVVGLLAGSTGMAAAGALPGSAQSIAHHVLGSVGVHVPEAPETPTEVATGPAATPWSDVGPSTSAPGVATAPDGSGSGQATPPAADDGTSDAGDGVTGTEGGGSTDSVVGSEGDGAGETDTVVRPEPSDVDGDDPGTVTTTEPSDVPPDDAVEEPPSSTTTTAPPDESPTTTTEPPGDEPPVATGEPTTTTTTLPDPGPPPPAEPAG